MSKRIGAAAYFECSAMKQPTNVQTVFMELARKYLLAHCADNECEGETLGKHPQHSLPLLKRMRSAGSSGTGNAGLKSSRTVGKSHSRGGLPSSTTTATVAAMTATTGKESCTIQ